MNETQLFDERLDEYYAARHSKDAQRLEQARRALGAFKDSAFVVCRFEGTPWVPSEPVLQLAPSDSDARLRVIALIESWEAVADATNALYRPAMTLRDITHALRAALAEPAEGGGG